MFDYVQVIAQHRNYPERLLVRNASGDWYLWFGDRPSLDEEAIPPRLALWLNGRKEMIRLPEPHFWIHRNDLPLMVKIMPKDASR